MPVYRQNRLARLREALDKTDADALLVTSIHNVFYLTGFTGSSGFVLVTPERAVFITDFRYKSQSADEVKGYEVVIQKGRWTEDVAAVVRESGIKRLGFEGRDMAFDTHAALAKKLDGVELVSLKDVVEGLRIIKDEDEVARITEAIRRAESGYTENLSNIVPGVVERDASLGMEFRVRTAGSLKMAFDTIIASGYRAALPHGIASEKVMEAGETVVIDFGAEAHGYQCDMTRSGVIGGPDEKQADIYSIVLDAQARAIAAVKPGVPCKDVDAAARDYIASKGYGDYFGHGLGHGVGVEVHEAPGVSPMSEDVLAPGMVLTIEPGIYIPGWGGFRIEDMVLVTEDGCRVMTGLPKGNRF
ncbi:MAG: aminopeptidase P family protein [Nitrospirae bacterium]|nr:aminopeptidase P family protein [Nitrospirota bacterium]